MKIQYKLMLTVGLMAFVPVVIMGAAIGWKGVTKGREALKHAAKSQLIAIRDTKKGEIENYFKTIENQVLTLSNNRMMIDAVGEFKEAFSNFKDEAKLVGSGEQKDKLSRYYTNDFGKKYKELNHGEAAGTSDLLNVLDADSIALQYQYIAVSTYPLGEKDVLVNPKDGTTYSRLHAKYHPHIRDILQKFEYYDIFLVDSDSGDILYSVYKELDFTTSLIDGPYANSGIAEVFQKANSAADSGFVALSDFSAYTPSYEAPAAFIASPIFDGEKKLGVLIFQMPVGRVNAIMTHNGRWAESGLGESGETYLVGSDFKMRSQSRFLLENKAGYLSLMKDVGLDNNLIKAIKSKDSSITLQPISTIGSKAAIAGESGFQIFPDYRNINVLSAYAPITINGLKWGIMSEIDEEEAFMPSVDLADTIIKSTIVIALVVMSLSIAIGFGIARSITKPINTTVSMLMDIAEGEGDLTRRLDESSGDELGLLGHWFNIFVGNIQTLVVSINSLASQLASASEEMSVTMSQMSGSTKEQQKQIEQVATAVTEMATSIQEVARNASGAEDSATRADSEVREGMQIVSESISSINSLAGEIERGSSVIHELERNSENIGSVLDVIKSIAEQTNLLALNAAIEAARAGEQGRGFAVVADEVRTLASRTQESTQEIQSMIELLQAESKKAVSVMNVSSTTTKTNVEQAARAGKSLDTIALAVADIMQVNTQIACASEEQSSVSEEIDQNIANISSAAEVIVVGSEQSNKSSAELALLAVALQDIVSQFKT